MHVVMLKSQLGNRGGLEKYTLRLGGAFAKRGCKVTILTSNYEGSQEITPGVKCINVIEHQPLSVLNVLSFDAACQKWINSHSYDVIFGMDRNRHQTHYRAGNGVHAAYLKRRREAESWYKSLSFAINPLHKALLYLEKKTYEDPNLKILFANSEMVRQEILELYKTPPEKIKVVHNGVEWEEMQSAFDQWPSTQMEIRRALNRNPDSFQLLFAGHGFRRKGLPYLLEGIKALGNKNIQLSVVGKDRDTRRWRQKADRMGLSDQVAFFGPQPTLKPFYQMADAIAVPSLYDPFANVTIEGLAMGLFVISSKANGGHELLTPKTGVTIDDLFNPQSVANALSVALDHKKTIESANAIRASVQSYDFSSQLEKIVSATLDPVQ
ncbi:MAG: glycosyltransferase family 4 protein [Parachlamydiales bacterium]|nr:glycosyltransferase family 4 protein [Parachlamydiales bacterium]